MRELLDLFKGIFMIGRDTNAGIGLSQFKADKKEIAKQKPKKQAKKQLLFSELIHD